MAPYSSTLAWKSPWTEEPGGLQSVGFAKSGTRLSNFTFTFHFHALELEMATHSSVLAWKIPEMGEPGGLPFMGSHRVRHDWSDLAISATAPSILQCSAFFMVQLSHQYMTTGKAITLTIWTFVSKMIFLLFNTLSRFVITFLPRSKCHLISYLQLLFSVLLEPKKIKSKPKILYLTKLLFRN